MNYSKIVSDGQKPRKSLFLSIRTKLIVTFCLLFVVVLVLVLLVGLRGLPFTDHTGTQGFQRTEAFRHLNLSADLKKERLMRWMEERRDDAKVASSSDMMLDNVTRLRAAIRAFTVGGRVKAELWDLVREEKSYRNLLSYIEVFVAAYGVYHKIHIADAETGKIIVSSNDADLDIDISKKLHFSEVLSSRDTFTTDITFDPLDNFALFHISHPIVSKEGKVIAVWMMAVDPEDIIKPMLHTGEGLGQSGEALLVNRDSKILTSLRYPLPEGIRAKPLEHRIKAKPAVFASKGEEGIIETEDYRGELVLAAYRHLRIASGFGWGMVVKRDEAELFAPLRMNIAYSFFIGLGGILIAVVFIIFLASGLVRPILSLSKSANKVADGDMDAKASVTSSDEVGQLAVIFNTMIQRIQDWHKELEKRVKVRTDDLKKTNEKLSKEIAGHEHAQKALRESEEKYRQLFTAVADAIMLFDAETKEFLDVNDATLSLYGYSREEFLRLRQPDITAEPEASIETIKKVMTGALARIPIRYHRKRDGTEFPVEISAGVLNLGDRQVVFGVVRDISERKRAEEEKARLEAKLQRTQKMESLGLMAGGIAHDLNNILSGIVSYPELLLMDLPEGSPLRKPIETIKESGHRAADVVSDLITIARGVATGKEVSNLNTMIEEYLSSAEHQELKTVHSLITFKTDLDSDLLNISCSSTHIKKSLTNLIANASEAIEGSGTVTISTMNRYLDKPLKGYEDVHKGEYTVLTVSDDGSGIPADDLERIFEPFYTKKVMGRSGTGLGLAVVWNTVQDHEGYINVKTSKKGTVFELYFPVTRDEVAIEGDAVPLKDYMGHGERVMVVDDEERQREIACGILTKLGYDAEAVSSGEEAVEYLKEQSVDLVVLDMIMPKGINGRETYERIIEIHPGQKAIIASGYAETPDVKNAQKLGAGKYIKKPYTMGKIGLAVKEELEK